MRPLLWWIVFAPNIGTETHQWLIWHWRRRLWSLTKTIWSGLASVWHVAPLDPKPVPDPVTVAVVAVGESSIGSWSSLLPVMIGIMPVVTITSFSCSVSSHCHSDNLTQLPVEAAILHNVAVRWEVTETDTTVSLDEKSQWQLQIPLPNLPILSKGWKRKQPWTSLGALATPIHHLESKNLILLTKFGDSFTGFGVLFLNWKHWDFERTPSSQKDRPLLSLLSTFYH